MKDKVEAIFELRAAAESKARAEIAAHERPTAIRLAALQSAIVDVERRTIVAIEACQKCGHDHTEGGCSA
ncbi:MAG: hypothetical protein NVSMB19_20910 [Vulcanimicrobiaceae bacterium]